MTPTDRDVSLRIALAWRELRRGAAGLELRTHVLRPNDPVLEQAQLDGRVAEPIRLRQRLQLRPRRIVLAFEDVDQRRSQITGRRRLNGIGLTARFGHLTPPERNAHLLHLSGLGRGLAVAAAAGLRADRCDSKREQDDAGAG